MATDMLRAGGDVWVRRGCALLVAGVAAYASYQHQREFALHAGADATSAGLWPLSVDGLLMLASTGLLKADRGSGRRMAVAVWLAFLLGIAVSLAANIAAAPSLEWQSVLVSGWPPVSLLLAVELLTHRGTPRQQSETAESEVESTETERERVGAKAEDVMWEHFQRERTQGRAPTGAELDRVAGTHNYGRAVLRRWRQTGKVETGPAIDGSHSLGESIEVGAG
ncbi:MAG TPA: DUF2637 domain-containing protein [Pseudonocardiaceae bacterium]|nr:DUF2637 domain-containing protein [Pseudonocardiaceae bacterium]